MMVKVLRRKFVFITTIMMVTLFGVIWTVNRVNNQYWADQDILAIIEMLTDSGVFRNDKKIDEQLIVERLTNEEPIYAFLVDSNGKVLDKQVLGQGPSAGELKPKTITAIMNAPAKTYKQDGFIYTKRVYDDGSALIVAINSTITDHSVTQMIINGLLMGGGFCLLVAIAFYLSRFITVPAEQALEREKRFISDASHELKTPLGAIGVNAQALELNGNYSIYVKNIIFETGRMSRLIERLLTLSKLEENELIDKKLFPLSTVSEEMMLSYESITFEKNRQLEYDIQPNVELNGSADEIRQLIAILLDNAIKNSEEGSVITFWCGQDASGRQIRVANYGHGIQEADLEHIFERFYTTDSSRNSGSFGLGLAIAKEIAERHGGQIRVDSSPDKETVFTVTFS
ncbi:MAG: HAMP domain-containing histidine kinase [Lachnospiraceae bacterium]|nr:HAMP domain-containing histidine kinase [Lachnospiraceae bacterium]